MASSQRKNVGDLGVWDTLRELEGQVRRFLSERMHDTAWFESGWVPEADLSELVEAYTLEVDLPGVAEDSLDLTLAGNVVTLTGERKPQCFVEHDAYRLRERRHGRFERSFELPGGGPRRPGCGGVRQRRVARDPAQVHPRDGAAHSRPGPAGGTGVTSVGVDVGQAGVRGAAGQPKCFLKYAPSSMELRSTRMNFSSSRSVMGWARSS